MYVLVQRYVYTSVEIMQGLCTHKDRDIHFTLVIDDSGINYTDEKDEDHLIMLIKSKYEVTQDWSGSLYCGIILKWYYRARLFRISITSCVTNTLYKFQSPTLTSPQ